MSDDAWNELAACCGLAVLFAVGLSLLRLGLDTEQSIGAWLLFLAARWGLR